MNMTSRLAIAGCVAVATLFGSVGTAVAASPATAPAAACTPTLLWGVTLDASAGPIDMIAEQKLIAKGFATAAYLSRASGFDLAYTPLGNTVATEEGYAGHDVIPSPPAGGVSAGAVIAARRINIIVVLADTADKMGANGQPSIGTIQSTGGRVTGTYDMSQMMQYSPSVRTDLYMQMGLSVMKGNTASTRCG